MATVLEQIRAENERRKQKSAEDVAIQAQPGPTVAKADLERAARIEKIKRTILAAEEQAGPPLLPLFRHGAMARVAGPVQGLASALGGEVGEWFGGEPATMGERYEAGEQAYRDRQHLAELKAGPVSAAAQEIAGAFASGPPFKTAVTSPWGMAGRAAGTGAGMGFAAGVAEGEGDWKDRFIRGAVEGTIGGGLGGALGLGGAMLARPGSRAAAETAIGKADEFGIPLTRGQATGDIAQQRTEQELTKGAYGPGPERSMAAHNIDVEAARSAAGQDIRSRFSPSRGDDRQESGRLLAESVRQKVEDLKALGGPLIEQALKAGVEIDAQALRNLPGRLDTALAGPVPQAPEHYVGVNTPASAEAMQRIKDFIGKVPGDPSARVSLAGVNQLRRNILGLSGANANDARTLKAIKNELDTWMDEIVTNSGADALPGLGVVGPEEALTDLREGNRLWREAKSIEEPRGRNVTAAQKNVARLAQEDTIGEHAVSMFKVDQRGATHPQAANTVKQLVTRFGADAPQVQQARDIMTTSLLDGGPERVANQIDNFLTNSRSAAEAAFTPDQIAELKRFAEVSRQLVPAKAATNYSQSSYGIMKVVMRNVLVGAGMLLGAKTGMAGDISGLAGAVGGGLMGRGAEGLRGAVATGKALNPVPGSKTALPIAVNTARAVPGFMPDKDTLSRLMMSRGLM